MRTSGTDLLSVGVPQRLGCISAGLATILVQPNSLSGMRHRYISCALKELSITKALLTQDPDKWKDNHILQITLGLVTVCVKLRLPFSISVGSVRK